MCLNFHLDFYNEEAQIQSMICDLNNKKRSSEERKVAHYEEKTEDLSEPKTELDRESNLAKCKHQIDIINFNWKSWVFINTIKLYSHTSNMLTVRFKTKSWNHWICG